MAKHLALLRGINVAGQKLIKMEDLRKLLQEEGFSNVETYIQSGNIILDSEESDKDVGEKISTAIKSKYGFDVGVIVINQKKLESVIAKNPFINQKGVETKQLYVAYLSDKPMHEHVEKLESASVGEDIFIVDGDIIYLRYLTSAGNSKLTNALIENRLKVVSTARNWNTTLKLLNLLKG